MSLIPHVRLGTPASLEQPFFYIYIPISRSRFLCLWWYSRRALCMKWSISFDSKIHKIEITLPTSQDSYKSNNTSKRVTIIDIHELFRVLIPIPFALMIMYVKSNHRVWSLLLPNILWSLFSAYEPLVSREREMQINIFQIVDNHAWSAV